MRRLFYRSLRTGCETEARRASLFNIGVLALILVVAYSVSTAQISVSLPNLSAPTDSMLRIPLTVSNLTGQGITAFEFIISCDTSIIRLSGTDQKGTLSEGLLMFANNRVRPFSPGKMKVACAAANPLSGSGVLVYLTGIVQKRIGPSALKISSFLLNDGKPNVRVSDGLITAVKETKSKDRDGKDTLSH